MRGRPAPGSSRPVTLPARAVEEQLVHGHRVTDVANPRLAAGAAERTGPTGDRHRERAHVAFALDLNQTLQRDLAASQAERGDAVERRDLVRRRHLGRRADDAADADLVAVAPERLREHQLVAE